MTDEIEVLDPEPHLAQPRWKIIDDHIVLTSNPNISWEVPEDFPEELYSEIAELPYDYLELGAAAADAKDRAHMAIRLYEAASDALDEAEERLVQFEAVNSSDKKEKALATLVYDLEAACNLLIRLSVALGIQPGGELYDNIKNLVEKYGMAMKHATDYAYDPEMGIRTTTAGHKSELDDALIAPVIKGEVQQRTIHGGPDDPFDYVISTYPTPELTEGEDG